jgi:hypothetical protein
MQDFQIEPELPILNIEQVMFKTRLKRLCAIYFAAPSIHLGPASDAGWQTMSGLIAINDLGKPFLLTGHSFDHMRAWPHQ